MGTFSSLNNAMAYIEEHLTEDIDYSEVSKRAFCSEYHILITIVFIIFLA